MAGNQVVLTFAGDAQKLIKESRKASDAVTDFSKETKQSSKATGDLTGRLGKLGAATAGAVTAIDEVGGSLQSIVDLQQAGAERASRLARAMNDVEQAQEDAAQAVRDFAQAGIDANQAAVDLEQANLDAATALKDYNKAVKEHGKNSDEAKQAAIDLKQANVDIAQAQEDQAQATRDASQATIDAKTAQLDLNDANREAHPPEMQKWADQISLVTPLLTTLVSVVALATAAQWSLNLSFLASPITWIVIGVAAIVAGIVLLATKTKFFQTVWNASWGAIKSAASAVGSWFAGPFVNFFVNGFNTVKGWIGKVGGWFRSMGTGIKNTFAKVTSWITAPFRSAFNAVARAWNSTVGSLHFSVPSWVPGLGGNSFGVPNIPTFHTGGVVPGTLGSETLALLRAGETVNGSGGNRGGGRVVVEVQGSGSLGSLFAGLVRRGDLRLNVVNGKVVTSRG